MVPIFEALCVAIIIIRKGIHFSGVLIFTDIREAVTKVMARLDELFAEQKFDELLTYYTDDFTGLYPGQEIIKDKKGKCLYFKNMARVIWNMYVKQW